MARLVIASVVLIAALIQGCTYMNQPARVLVTREADTLRVMLDPVGFARWSVTRDSLVIVCESCEQGPRIIERFENGRVARFEVSRYDSLQWRVLGNQFRDSLVVIENYDLSDSNFTGKERPRVKNRRIKTVPQRKMQDRPEVAEKKKVTPPVQKRAKSLRVSANEGVAVYKDKSKREVLKILPKGAQLPLLSREGDVYSVSVDGAEGFVEAEAVEVE